MDLIKELGIPEEFINDERIKPLLKTFIEHQHKLQQTMSKALYEKHGILSMGVEFPYQGKTYVVISKAEFAPFGYFLVAEAGAKEFGFVESHVLYCPKTAAFLAENIQDPQRAAQMFLLDPEVQKEIQVFAALMEKEAGKVADIIYGGE